MTSLDIETYTSNGVDVPVKFDAYSGSFTAEAGGKRLSNEKYAGLKAAIDRATKSAKVEVEVHVIRVKEIASWSGGGITSTRAVLTGLHGANGNVLATIDFRDNPQKVQLTHERGVSFVGGDTTPAALAEYDRLLKLKTETAKLIGAWERAHEIKPKDAVERAIAAKSGSDED